MTPAPFPVAVGASGAGFDHAPWLKLYVAAGGAASPQNRPAWFARRTDEPAFYVNGYSALTATAVVERHPLPGVRASVLTRARFHRFAKHPLGGTAISLENVENQIRARADGK